MEISTIGLDLAKNVFQVHGISATGEVVIRKALRRSQMLPFFAKLPACLVGAEACGTSHHWARELTKRRHEAGGVREAVCEARQERCRRCGSDLRSGHTSDDAVRADQVARTTGGSVAAPRAQPSDQTAHPAGQHNAQRTRRTGGRHPGRDQQGAADRARGRGRGIEARLAC